MNLDCIDKTGFEEKGLKIEGQPELFMKRLIIAQGTSEN